MKPIVPRRLPDEDEERFLRTLKARGALRRPVRVGCSREGSRAFLRRMQDAGFIEFEFDMNFVAKYGAPSGLVLVIPLSKKTSWPQHLWRLDGSSSIDVCARCGARRIRTDEIALYKGEAGWSKERPVCRLKRPTRRVEKRIVASSK